MRARSVSFMVNASSAEKENTDNTQPSLWAAFLMKEVSAWQK